MPKLKKNFRECVGRPDLQEKLKEIIQSAIGEFRC